MEKPDRAEQLLLAIVALSFVLAAASVSFAISGHPELVLPWGGVFVGIIVPLLALKQYLIRNEVTRRLNGHEHRIKKLEAEEETVQDTAKAKH